LKIMPIALEKTDSGKREQVSLADAQVGGIPRRLNKRTLAPRKKRETGTRSTTLNMAAFVTHSFQHQLKKPASVKSQIRKCHEISKLFAR